MEDDNCGVSMHVSSVGQAGVLGDVEAIREALTELMDRYERPLYNFLLVLLRDRDAAQDCAQDTFIRAFEHLRQGREVNVGWLYKVARNRALDEFRHRERVEREPANYEALDENFTDDRHGRVQFALSQLSSSDRELLYLFDVDRLDAAEIGRMLGVRRGTVHVRVFRARERFRHIYNPQGDNL